MLYSVYELRNIFTSIHNIKDDKWLDILTEFWCD